MAEKPKRRGAQGDVEQLTAAQSNGAGGVIHIVNLNEITLFRFLFFALLGKKPYVLNVHAFFPQAAEPLKRLTGRLVERGRACWAIDLCPELRQVWDYPPTVLLYDIFGITESWQDAYYRFYENRSWRGGYALAYKHITCAHTWAYQISVLLLSRLHEQYNGNYGARLRVIGAPADMLAMAGRYSGQPIDREHRPGWKPTAVINAVIALLATLRGLAFIAGKTKIRVPNPASIFLAADHMEDFRDVRLFKEAQRAGELLLVGRMGFPERSRLGELKNARLCTPLDGAFSIPRALAAAWMVVRDGAFLLLSFAGLEPAHYYRIATLPFRRAALKGLFNRYRPAYFWGRDPYNVDHILRHQELNEIGGTSLGIANELPAYSIIFPHIRYISFDSYYVYGTELYEKYYAANWPRDMRLVPAASHSLTREQLDVRHREKPADIAIFTAIFITEPALVDFVRTLAEAFPDRTVYLQVKWTHLGTADAKAFIAACTRHLPNVRHTEEMVYDLIAKARYSFSDPSSVIAEAVQMGACSFALDISPAQKTTIYRDHDRICVAGARQAIEKIRRLESGDWVYPFKSLGNLIDQSGRTSVEAACADLGLVAADNNDRVSTGDTRHAEHR